MIPSAPISSNRPINGDIYVAPAFAANIACAALKQRVTLTLIFSFEKFLHAFKPSTVSGTFITTFDAILDNFFPSNIIVSASVAVTSALTGPSTILQICSIASIKFNPDFAIKEGLVVTPSIKPVSLRDLISFMSAESINIFILYPNICM